MHIARLKQKDLGRFDSSCIRYSTLYRITHTARITAVQLPCTYGCTENKALTYNLALSTEFSNVGSYSCTVVRASTAGSYSCTYIQL